MTNEFTGLNRQLNVMVVHIANRIHPLGFDISDKAPSTYEELRDYVKEHNRYCVYSGGSENTIYGDKEVNYSFRAWHDYHHVTNGLGFTPEDEIKVIGQQVQDILTIYGDNAISRECIRLIEADGNGQVAYYEKYKSFPDNQIEFVKDYLETGIIHKQF